MMNVLQSLSPITTPEGLSVKVPRLYYFNHQTNTQIIEDIPGAESMNDVLFSESSAKALLETDVFSIGFALGRWLRSFHSWTSAPAQASLREEIGRNEPIRKLKYLVTYGSFMEVLEDFPDAMGGDEAVLEDVRTMAAKEFEEFTEGEAKDKLAILHGDLWTGK
jgi:hypothetical protein